MAKHIHIHLSSATRDQDYKRDSGGKFATTGASGGDIHHHMAQAAHHANAQKAHPTGSAKWAAHESPRSAHMAAAAALQKAHHAATRAQNPELAAVHVKKAQGFANTAAEHEAYLPKEGANAHKLLNPGTAKLMNSGQKALSGVKSPPTKALPKKA